MIEFQADLLTSFIVPFCGTQPDPIALGFRHLLDAFLLGIFAYAFLPLMLFISHHCLSDASYTWGTAPVPCFHRAFPSCFKEQCTFPFWKEMLFYFCFCTWCVPIYNCVLGSPTFQIEGSRGECLCLVQLCIF